MNELLGWYGYGKEAALSRVSNQVRRKLMSEDMTDSSPNRATVAHSNSQEEADKMPVIDAGGNIEKLENEKDDTSSVCSGKCEALLWYLRLIVSSRGIQWILWFSICYAATATAAASRREIFIINSLRA